MDPVGPQKKIKSSEYHVSFEKLLKGGGSKEKYGGMDMKSGTKKTFKARDYDEWQGKVKGGIKHTYGVNGENDPD